jgi:hypothetical protein
MKTKVDITETFNHLAWEAINNLETYCPEKLGTLKKRMTKANNVYWKQIRAASKKSSL